MEMLDKMMVEHIKMFGFSCKAVDRKTGAFT